VIAENDRAIAPEQQKSTAKRMGAKILTLPSSHVAMLAKPQEVAKFIAEAAASISL
jgi:pimeloyl-ACP methyl ester carboxylesterase